MATTPRQWLKRLRDANLIPNKPSLSAPPAIAHNGQGAFIPPLHSLHITYAKYTLGRGGNSKGVTSYILSNYLAVFARDHPYIAISVSPALKPTVTATYMNQQSATVDLAGMQPDEVRKTLKRLAEVQSPHSLLKGSRYPVPVLSGKRKSDAAPQWNPLTAPESQTYRP
ncbi:hypothetical protein BJ742DRAFT_766999 [Cladochytrium replicatum]|nr:hypothetical protein BJ742DRAFT_766999 [Cladochytrium replicatum]